MTRVAVAAVALLAAFGAGWAVNGWRLTASHEAGERERLETEAESARLAERAREKKDGELHAVRAVAASNLEKAREANRLLRDRVDLGAVGLRVRADCSAAVPSAFAASGGGAGAGAELAADARPAYHALREGIVVTESRLKACQAELRALVER
ncbi:MAG: lysis system i-spanin subunit Rz [Roseateles sp.]